jgi:TolB-like protein/DNA-binding winged helix-turn-helix (wHTH) protein
MSLWEELKRRKVVKVAALYAVLAWILIPVADTFFPALQLPAWTVTLVAALLILGFPVALVLSWAYELTAEGVKRIDEVSPADIQGDVTSGAVYWLDGFRIDAQHRVLYRIGGDAIPLAPKVFDTLLYFVERPGQLQDKHELIDAIWPDVVVEENNLNQAISALRRVLGEAPGQNRFIATEPGRGYRFVATVRAEAHPGVGPDVPRGGFSGWIRSKIGYAIGAVAIATVGLAVVGLYRSPGPSATASIAVLPFEYQSAADENAAFLADGLHSDLLTHLSKISALHVISSTSVQQYRDGPRNLREIGRELDVASILEGGVQRVGDQVRVNVQLIDAATDAHLWGEIYDAELTAEDIFAIQSDIARSIAAALRATVTPQEIRRLDALPTDNTLAYEFYLRALDYEEQGQPRFMDAIANYERAVAEDPEFVLAHARLGMIDVRAFADGVDRSPMRLDRGRLTAERALELDPGLPEGHVTLAYYHYISGRVTEAAAELLIAAPNAQGDDQFFIIRGSVNEQLGEWERALEDQKRALELNPRDVTVLGGTATMFRKMRDYESAGRICERIVDVRPELADRAAICAAMNSYLGRGETSAIDSLPLTPANAPVVRPLKSGAALYERDYEKAARLAQLPEDEQEASAIVQRVPGRVLFLARVHELAGNTERARQLYQRVADAMADDEVDVGQVPPSASDWARRFFRLRALAGINQTADVVGLARQLLVEAEQEHKQLANRSRLELIFDVFARGDRKDIALHELDKYLSEPDEWSIESLMRDPRLDPISNEPAFLDLVEKYERQ